MRYRYRMSLIFEILYIIISHYIVSANSDISLVVWTRLNRSAV